MGYEGKTVRLPDLEPKPITTMPNSYTKGPTTLQPLTKDCDVQYMQDNTYGFIDANELYVRQDGVCEVWALATATPERFNIFDYDLKIIRQNGKYIADLRTSKKKFWQKAESSRFSTIRISELIVDQSRVDNPKPQSEPVVENTVDEVAELREAYYGPEDETTDQRKPWWQRVASLLFS